MRKVMFCGELCSLRFGSYSSGHLLIELIDRHGQNYARATVNIPTETLGEGEVFIKDYSENEGMLGALIEAGILADTGKRVKTGFVEVPVCKLLVEVEELV